MGTLFSAQFGLSVLIAVHVGLLVCYNNTNKLKHLDQLVLD